MNRASLDLSTVRPSDERQGDGAPQDITLPGFSIFDLDTRAVQDLVQDDTKQRHLDTEAVIGIWAQRADLCAPEAFLRNLREDDRAERWLDL